MKPINQFVDSLFGHLSKKVAKELKLEIHSYLLKTVVALKTEGFTEQEAFTTALSRFRDENRVLLKKLHFQKKLTQWLLISTFVFLLVGFVISMSLFMRDKTYRETFDLMDNLAQSYQLKTHFTFEEERSIQDMVERNSKWFDNISYFAFIKVFEIDDNKTSAKLFTHGKEDFGESDIMRLGYEGNENVHWYVEWEFKTYDYLKNEFLYYVFFAISGLLFILWGIFRYYNRKYLKAFVLTLE